MMMCVDVGHAFLRAKARLRAPVLRTPSDPSRDGHGDGNRVRRATSQSGITQSASKRARDAMLTCVASLITVPPTLRERRLPHSIRSPSGARRLTRSTTARAPTCSRACPCERLFAAGVDGIALFGTTGEGQSFSVAQRRRGLDALLAAGIPPQRVVAGTGCAAIADTIELTRHAVGSGCAGALVLPPFFFKGLSDEGIYASYARLIDGVADARLRLYLYHIPQVTCGAHPARRDLAPR